MHDRTENVVHDIEDDIELGPTRRQVKAGESKYPVAKLKIGQSFFIETKTPDGTRNTVRSAAKKAKITVECRQVTKKVKGDDVKGLRVWRVADRHTEETRVPGRGSKR